MSLVALPLLSLLAAVFAAEALGIIDGALHPSINPHLEP